jgi:transposase
LRADRGPQPGGPLLTGRPRQFELALTYTERHALTAAAQAVQTVGHWRRRFHQHGLAGLSDAPRSGHPRTYDDERVAALLQTVLASRPRAGTHWSIRTVAAETGISKSTVQRYFALFGVQPHRSRSFSLSTDPLFVDKVRDVVGLYLNPPDKALVLCVDEKSQIQALERPQPAVPTGLGHVEGVTPGYIRHGTTTLFAALDVATGAVLAQCQRRHRHQEFLRFLERIDASVPPDLDVHLVIDNYATHKHAAVRAWLAARPRYHAHFTPTYAVLAEPGRAVVRARHPARDPSRLGPSDAGAGAPHRAFVAAYNATARRFAWTATPESILAKLERLLKAISGLRH